MGFPARSASSIGQTRRFLAIAAALSLCLAACASTGPVVVGSEDVTEPLADEGGTQTTTVPPADVVAVDALDDWRIGAEYTGTLFVVDGVELDASTVKASFLGKRQVGLSGGGCTAGSGVFDWNAGVVSNWERRMVLIECRPTDVDVAEAIFELSNLEFVMSGSLDTLTLASEHYYLQLGTGEAGETAVISDTERFVGFETSIAGIDPTRIQLEAPAFFVLVATLPTCQLHGGPEPIDDVSLKVILPPRPEQDPCEFSPEQDRLAQDFLHSEPTLVRAGDVVTVSGEAGTVRFMLANPEEQPIVPETVPPPPLVNPDPPVRPTDAQKGRASTPWFAERAGSTEPGGIDIPLPPEWDTQDRTRPAVSVVGRGTFGVSRIDEWTPASNLTSTDGPVAVSIPTYQVVDGEIVESGVLLTGQQYRYDTNDSIVKTIVWIFPHNGLEVVATVSYPEFGEDSDFVELTRNQPLTGLDPNELLKDVRIFE